MEAGKALTAPALQQTLLPNYRFMQRCHRGAFLGASQVWGQASLLCTSPSTDLAAPIELCAPLLPPPGSPGQGYASQACPSQPWADYLMSLRGPCAAPSACCIKTFKACFSVLGKANPLWI